LHLRIEEEQREYETKAERRIRVVSAFEGYASTTACGSVTLLFIDDSH
jgi:hypothetical protein